MFFLHENNRQNPSAAPSGLLAYGHLPVINLACCGQPHHRSNSSYYCQHFPHFFILIAAERFIRLLGQGPANSSNVDAKG